MVAATAKADYAIADSKERPMRSMCMRFSSMHVPMSLIVVSDCIQIVLLTADKAHTQTSELH